MKRRNQKGQTLVMAAFTLIILLGFSGLAIDLGVLRYERRVQQTAADAAAIAGADELRFNHGGIVLAGRNAATGTGFTDGGTACTATSSIGCISVAINTPPSSGPHASNANYVEAIVTVVQPTFFMRALGRDRSLVAARAVATTVGDAGYGSGCIYTLGPPAKGIDGIFAGGTNDVNAPTCGIFDNGNFKASGATLQIDAAAIGVAGRVQMGGDPYVHPTPVEGIVPVSDPLAFLQPPPVGTAIAFDPANPVPNSTYSSIRINNTQVVNFPAGTYVVAGNLTINAGATVCNQVGSGCSPTGTANSGVTFYVTNGGTVTIDGGATVQLSAPTSGTYAGILLYQDRADTSAAKVEGNSNSFYEGAMYFPTAQLTFGGTSFTNSEADYTIIVSNNLKIDGTAEINIRSNYYSLPGGVSIIEHAVLVE